MRIPKQGQQPHSARGVLEAHRTGANKPGGHAHSQISGHATAPGLGPSGASMPELPMAKEVYERLAAGGRSDVIAKPKSLKAAEHAKQQEERRQRERQERELERERERAKVDRMVDDVVVGSAKMAASAVSPPTGSNKKGCRSVVIGHVEGDSAHTGLNTSFEDPREPQEHEQRLNEPAMRLRLMDLPPKRSEDNYDLSECDYSDGEAEPKSRDRSAKHVPKWCSNYLQELSKQADVDPDTIFTDRVPRCVLDDVFPDKLYKQVGKNRPKRQRGSSGDWRRDRLTHNEVGQYKTRMGQIRSWDVVRTASPSANSVGKGKCGA